jgi:protein TonB
MEEKIVDLKKLYPLHIRIGFLVTLVLLILGFMFIPEMKREPTLPKFSKPIQVDKLPPQLQNIVKPPPPPKPKMPVAAKSDEEVEAETIEKTDFSGLEKKEADVDIAPPKFVPFEVAPKVLNPEVLDFYPQAARVVGIEGKLFLELWVDKKGTVRKVVVKKPLHSTIDSEAVRRAYQLRFKPAMQRDKPVDVWVSFPVTFKLGD